MHTVCCSSRRGGVYPSMHWVGGLYPSMHWAGGCLPGEVSAWGCLTQCMPGYTPPVDRILDTSLWKHYLSATMLQTVIIAKVSGVLWEGNVFSRVCPSVKHSVDQKGGGSPSYYYYPRCIRPHHTETSLNCHWVPRMVNSYYSVERLTCDIWFQPNPVADPGFSQGGGANSQKCYYFSIFCRKLHENGRIWTPRGGARPWRPPLDPPMEPLASEVSSVLGFSQPSHEVQHTRHFH